MIKLPAHIAKQMRFWREGLISFPNDYIEFHRTLAFTDMTNQGFNVKSMEMVSDGWADGFRVLQLVIIDTDGNEKTIKWHDSGAWFVEGAGWSRWKEMISNG